MSKKIAQISSLITCLLTVTLLMCLDTHGKASPITVCFEVTEDCSSMQEVERATFALRPLLKINWSIYHTWKLKKYWLV